MVVRLHAVAGYWKGLSTLAGLCTADAKTKSPDTVCGPQSDLLPGIPDPMALFRIWSMILVDL